MGTSNITMNFSEKIENRKYFFLANFGHFMLIQGPRYIDVCLYVYHIYNNVTIQVQDLTEHS
jgi:hypothetical protein